jgi:hypothetical protein
VGCYVVRDFPRRFNAHSDSLLDAAVPKKRRSELKGLPFSMSMKTKRPSVIASELPTGLRDRQSAARSPWQNAYCERLIGSIRRDCLDHVVVFGERHLRHLLCCSATYNNKTRTHLSLNKGAPIPRPALINGRILGVPILGGLHHQ